MSCTSESGSVFKGNDISVGFLDHTLGISELCFQEQSRWGMVAEQRELWDIFSDWYQLVYLMVRTVFG